MKLFIVVLIFSVAVSQDFETHIISSTADGSFAVYAEDINSDGNMDILFSSRFDNEIAWYENSGAIPEFSNIMMPFVSVLAIVGLNYRRRL